jgi:hypothetical protein
MLSQELKTDKRVLANEVPFSFFIHLTTVAELEEL